MKANGANKLVMTMSSPHEKKTPPSFSGGKMNEVREESEKRLVRERE